jgi:hypothetical protein
MDELSQSYLSTWKEAHAPQNGTSATHQETIDAEPLENGYAGEFYEEPTGPSKAVILQTTEQFEFNNKVLQALVPHPNLYFRGNVLVTVVRTRKRKGKAVRIRRDPGTPTIALIEKDRLSEMITQVAQIEQAKGNKLVRVIPPAWCPRQIIARGTWDDIRHLAGIVETPVLLPSGEVLERPGWDEESGILYEPTIDFPTVPDQIPVAKAKEAAEELLELVCDFPFVKHHEAAWLAALLTPFARYAIDGPCPAFLLDANSPGTGKTLLAEVIGILATGRTMPRTSWREEDAEMRKTITAICIEGDPVCLFDNLGNGISFGGDSINTALTGLEWKDRILGVNKMTGRLPLTTVFYASGNNLSIEGDTERRVILCRIESAQENPEERSGFTIPNLVEHVKQHRGRYVVAALTILRGFAHAGRPDQKLSTFGSYESWSHIVRDAVYWATGQDCREGRKDLRSANTTTSILAPLLKAWERLPDGDKGLTAAEVLRILERDKETHPPQHSELRDLLMEWSRNKDLPTSRTIGSRLRDFRGRIVGGRRLDSVEYQGIQRWRVVAMEAVVAVPPAYLTQPVKPLHGDIDGWENSHDSNDYLQSSSEDPFDFPYGANAPPA